MRKAKIIARLATLGFIILSSGCASFATNPYGYSVAGDTIAPESVIRASSEARNANINTDVDAHERYARLRFVKKCYEDFGPVCMSLGGYGGGMYMPYDYTTMGLLAVSDQGTDGQDGSEADASDAKRRADRALNEFLELGVELRKEE